MSCERGWLCIGACLVLLVSAGCTTDDGQTGPPSPIEGRDVEELLGPEDPASGEPVHIGLVSDGATPTFDNSDEARAAEATAEYWNEHRGGIGGRPIEMVTCDTGADPAGGTDCANQLVEQDVVAVVVNTSAVVEAAWEPLHAAGIPTMLFQTFGEGLLTDDTSTFSIISPLSTLFGLPISVAETEGADKVTFVVLDIPQATGILGEGAGPEILERSGIESVVVPVPLGTADMTPQMQQVVEDDPGVVHVIGNDAFCIAAFNGLEATGYQGAITAISQCITDATREAVAGDVLEGMYLTASLALGGTDDPTYQLYEAVMSTYGEGIRDTENTPPMGTYAILAALATSLQGIGGDITPETVTRTIKAMPQEELPGGGGVRFRCGGSAVPAQPAVCTGEWLRTQLDADGHPTTYEPIDSTDLLAP